MRHMLDKTKMGQSTMTLDVDARSDGVLTSNDASTSGGISDDMSRDEVKEVRRLTESETRGVRIWRVVVGVIILGAGGVLSWGTYFYLSRQVQDETEDKFHLFANTIEDISLMHFQDMSLACESLAREITAQSVSSDMKLPILTMKNWEVHAGDSRRRGNIEALWYFPFLRDTQEILQFNQHSETYSLGWQIESGNAMRKIHPELRNTTFSMNNATKVWKFGNPATPWIRPPTLEGPATPMWSLSPPSQGNFGVMMLDFYPLDDWKQLMTAATVSKGFLMGSMGPEVGWIMDRIVGEEAHLAYHQALHGKSVNTNTSISEQAHGYIIHPVFTDLDDQEGTVGGFISGSIGFDSFLVDILPSGIRGIRVVVQNTCNTSYTYELDGNEATYLGLGDLSDPDYAHLRRNMTFEGIYKYPDLAMNVDGHCQYMYIVSPTALYDKDNESPIPLIFTIGVGAIFLLMAFAFFTYDMFVQKRNNKMVDTAARSNAIVSSIFPGTIRDRLLEQEITTKPGLSLQPTKSHLKNFLNNKSGAFYENSEFDEIEEGVIFDSKPIADLFTETTIMFADISGFTAWSSVREPSQVFTLLETVYRSFDMIARRRGVFKVETVGDCYVAVCGLPDPRKDHAIIMARFARDCLRRFSELSQKLEVMLGPDTGDLGMRIGLHSGPVTAGVLRGERSRFQLFGDTMNTASRMESTGQVNRIQVSEETARLLMAAGKKNWLYARDSPVQAKGKGFLETYWLRKLRDADESSNGEGTNSSDGLLSPDLMPGSKNARLVDWNVEVMLKLLKQIIKRRELLGILPEGVPALYEGALMNRLDKKDAMILDEVEEVIRLPADRSDTGSEGVADEDVPQVVVDELVEYVTSIAAMYNRNPFHNFEHASHVTMSVVKLLSRIVAPSEVDFEKSAQKEEGATLHDHTYGITSDPLTQFSCVLSALIHDADHPGVPNAQLVKEGKPLAVHYKGKSVAEQNSVELAWSLLMEERYENLRATIYVSENEMMRFRQLVVNSVMATDIVDKELKALRNGRWETAFSLEMPKSEDEQENVNRKATIVIEHLIQASDVAHTMQHWHIYRKWNERFFIECYEAYRNGRAESDPSENWYKGEMGFFDFYIIPLAKKLKECGVFGVSSDEYLNYATKNRREWEERGQEIVAYMIEKVKSRSDHGQGSAADDFLTTPTPSQRQLQVRQDSTDSLPVEASTASSNNNNNSSSSALSNQNSSSSALNNSMPALGGGTAHSRQASMANSLPESWSDEEGDGKPSKSPSA